eukprot:scaffold8783_cov135-Isochrysis_galbana.AAC.4
MGKKLASLPSKVQIPPRPDWTAPPDSAKDDARSTDSHIRETPPGTVRSCRTDFAHSAAAGLVPSLLLEVRAAHLAWARQFEPMQPTGDGVAGQCQALAATHRGRDLTPNSNSPSPKKHTRPF